MATRGASLSYRRSLRATASQRTNHASTTSRRLVVDRMSGVASEPGREFSPFTFFEEVEDVPRDPRRLPRLVRRSLQLAMDAGRRQLVIVVVLQVAAAAGTAAQLLVGRDVLANLLSDPAGDFGSATVGLVLLLSLTFLIGLATTAQTEQGHLLGELVEREAMGRLLDVVSRLDLEEFESSAVHDRVRRAKLGAESHAFQVVLGVVTASSNALSVIAILLALGAIQPLLVVLGAFGYVPLWLATARNSRAYHRFYIGMTEPDRRRAYLETLLVGRHEAKELRAFDLAPVLRARYDALWVERLTELRRVVRLRILRSGAGAFGSSGVTLLCGGAVAWLYTAGRLSLAAAGVALAGLVQLGARLRGLGAGAAAIFQSSLFLEDFTNLVPARQADPPQPGTADQLEVVRLEHVSFEYPNSSRRAVDEVTLELEKGQILAIVGENGSGKTTLAKVVAGLYRPTSGRLLWNGAELDDADRAIYRSDVAVVFQDFVRYILSARENITAGRPHREASDAQVEAAARAAGAHEFLESLPSGYETVLGREFWGSVDLSTGQWQRVAIARAFFRDAPFVILDEPTSALDPRAEAQLFERIKVLFAGRAVLLISHRFSSVRMADRILVMNAGRIVEDGSHVQLMAQDGLYADLYRLQASAYRGHDED